MGRAYPRAALAAAGVLLAAACGGGGHSSPGGSDAPQGSAPAAVAASPAVGKPSTIATAKGSVVQIFDQPTGTTPSMTLKSPNPDGVKRVFLVVARQSGWLKVMLPVPPNGSSGWVRASDVTTSTTPYLIKVQRSEHRIQVFKGTAKVMDEPAGIGKTDTPTPGGLYYITELLKAPNPKGDYGPYAYGLSGYSTSLTQFNGHDPIIGIHGTNQPKLVGTSVSHGCVRVKNDIITKLAGMLPLGTTVQIVA